MVISFITHIYILSCCFLCSQVACMTYIYGHKSLSYENVQELNAAAAAQRNTGQGPKTILALPGMDKTCSEKKNLYFFMRQQQLEKCRNGFRLEKNKIKTPANERFLSFDTYIPTPTFSSISSQHFCTHRYTLTRADMLFYLN